MYLACYDGAVVFSVFFASFAGYLIRELTSQIQQSTHDLTQKSSKLIRGGNKN